MSAGNDIQKSMASVVVVIVVISLAAGFCLGLLF